MNENCWLPASANPNKAWVSPDGFDRMCLLCRRSTQIRHIRRTFEVEDSARRVKLVEECAKRLNDTKVLKADAPSLEGLAESFLGAFGSLEDFTTEFVTLARLAKSERTRLSAYQSIGKIIHAAADRKQEEDYERMTDEILMDKLGDMLGRLQLLHRPATNPLLDVDHAENAEALHRENS